MYEFDHVFEELNKSLSVFYFTSDYCMHKLGFSGLPLDEKYFFELTEELNSERKIAQEWMIGSPDFHGSSEEVKDIIIKGFNNIDEKFSQLNEDDPFLKEKLQDTFSLMASVSERFYEITGDLSIWSKKISQLHDDIMVNNTTPVDNRYSWYNAKIKLEPLMEYIDNINISWIFISRTLDDVSNSLEKALITPTDIIAQMFTETAVNEWQDLLQLSNKFIELNASSL